MNVLAALGDSVSCGEGVGINIHPEQTWPALLAGTTGMTLESLAVAGAKVRDVRDLQLPQTPRCEIATVLVGLNDVCRGGFDEERFHYDVAAIVSGLHWRADRILLARLPDPSRFLWAPNRVRDGVRRRLSAANRAIDAAAATSPRVDLLDLESLAGLNTRFGWAIDRVHPSQFGHVAIATEAADVIGAAAGPELLTLPPTAGRDTAKRAWWIVRHGTPYIFRKGHTFVRPIAEGLRRAG